MGVQQQALAGFNAAAGGVLPTCVGVGAYQASLGAITLPLPSGVLQNDILAGIFVTNPAEAITIAGWTSKITVDADRRITLLWKRAGASETDPTTNDSGTRNLGQLFAVRGCPTSGDPFDVTGSGSTDNTGLSSTGSAAGATTTVANCLIIAACGVASVGGASTSFFSAWANASLANITERMDSVNQAGVNNGFGMATGEKATAGAYGATTVTLSSAFGWFCFSAAFKPA